MDIIRSFSDILKQMDELCLKKNHDYGDSFFKTCEEFGLISPIIRITDKLNRLKQLIRTNDQQVNESIEDTLLDMANYCVMALCWYKDHNNDRA